MAQLFIMPFRAAFDANNRTIPGAKAWFTLAGTNTATPVYTASNLLTPQANPMIANGVGRFPTAYLDSAISYRVRIYGESSVVGVDTPLEEYDPYTGALTSGLAGVTYAEIQNVAASRLLGNPTGAGAPVSEISLAGGLSFSGTTLTAAGALTPTSVASTGAVTSTGGVVGYATGAGGTITQAGIKSIGVTLHKLTGEITMNSASLAAGTIVSFTLTNNQATAAMTAIANHVSGGTQGAYSITAAPGSGNVVFYVRNNTAGALSEAIVIRYTLHGAATA